MEIAGIELDTGQVHELRLCHRAVYGAYHGAVLRCDAVDVVGRDYATGARHALHDDRRISRNILAHETGKQACIDIEACTLSATDDDTYLLAAVEFLDRLCASRDAECHKHCQRNGTDVAECTVLHGLILPVSSPTCFAQHA